VSSELMPTRLTTGAILRELALQDDRLRFQRLTGAGPETGWVSTKLKDSDKALVARVGGSPAHEAQSLPGLPRAPTAPTAAAQPVGPVVGRKVRILALHATPGNSNIMKFQTAGLRKFLGAAETEWLFIDAPTPWQPLPGSPWPNDQERSEYERRLAQNKPFVQWYRTAVHGEGPSGGDIWEGVEDCVKHVWEYITKEAPIDVVVAFSQGSSMVSLLVEVMRRFGQAPPWRLSVFFNGGNIDDGRFQFEAGQSSQVPTVYVGGRADPFGGYILGLVRGMYTNLSVLEHDDGHSFPTTQPRANEVYEEVSALVRSACGLAAKPAASSRPASSPQAAREAGLPEGDWTIDYLGQARGACKACGTCRWYQWSPSALPEGGDLEGASMAQLYSFLRCQACKCDFLDHRSICVLDKPAGYHPRLDEAGVSQLVC